MHQPVIHVDDRRMSYRPARFPITAAEINTVVQIFYARIRTHEVLGPVFFASIPDEAEIWAKHEAKIGRFWRSVLLSEQSFDGNPQVAHGKNELIRPEHFEIWLGVFDNVLAENLTTDQAAAWSNLAHRVGASLRMGLIQSQAKPDDIPMFN